MFSQSYDLTNDYLDKLRQTEKENKDLKHEITTLKKQISEQSEQILGEAPSESVPQLETQESLARIEAAMTDQLA